MIRTRICDLLEIEYPILLGGMGSVLAPVLVAAVSGAGGLGALGCSNMNADQVRKAAADIRALTDKPFGLNFLIFIPNEEGLAAALDARPAVMAFAWPRPEQDLKPFFDRAHEAGSKVTFMTGEVPEARRAAEAGADVIIAQGTAGGGHVNWMATMTLVPMVVDAVSPVPVLAAGGVADGRGLAAALALGADGVPLRTAGIDALKPVAIPLATRLVEIPKRNAVHRRNHGRVVAEHRCEAFRDGGHRGRLERQD